MIIKDCVLDVASQLGGAPPGLVTTYDKSRYHNDGALTGIEWAQLSTGLWVAVVADATDKIVVSNALSLNFYEAFSLEVWLQPVSIAGSPYYYYRNVYRTAITATGQYGLFIAGSGGNVWYYSAAGVMTAGNWAHTMGTYDTNFATIYVNGVGYQIANTSGTVNVTGVDLQLPLTPAGGGMIGQFGLARGFNYALTPAQVRARYHSTKWMFGVPL